MEGDLDFEVSPSYIVKPYLNFFFNLKTPHKLENQSDKE